MSMQSTGILKIIAMVVLCFAVSGLGALGSKPSVSGWYNELIKPALTPPSIAFGIVWPILYTLMGIAAGMIWMKGLSETPAKIAFVLFLVQLVLNAIWTPLFFGRQAVGLALIDIIVLWLVIVLTVISFAKQSTLASALLWPYLLWVSFAVYLNAGFWHLNR